MVYYLYPLPYRILGKPGIYIKKKNLEKRNSELTEFCEKRRKSGREPSKLIYHENYKDTVGNSVMDNGIFTLKP